MKAKEITSTKSNGRIYTPDYIVDNILDLSGYNSYWQVINAKDCGIPQNRERVFVVSIRKDIDKGFVFPLPQTLQCSMNDFLEENVEEKYYLSDAFIEDAENRSLRMAEIGNGFKFEPRERERERRIIAHIGYGNAPAKMLRLPILTFSTLVVLRKKRERSCRTV